MRASNAGSLSRQPVFIALIWGATSGRACAGGIYRPPEEGRAAGRLHQHQMQAARNRYDLAALHQRHGPLPPGVIADARPFAVPGLRAEGECAGQHAALLSLIVGWAEPVPRRAHGCLELKVQRQGQPGVAIGRAIVGQLSACPGFDARQAQRWAGGVRVGLRAGGPGLTLLKNPGALACAYRHHL